MYDLSFCIRYLQGWKFYTFSYLLDFVTKTQNPSVYDPRSWEFTVPSLDDFVGGDRDKLLLCPITALRKYLAQPRKYYPDIFGLFVSTFKRNKQVS